MIFTISRASQSESNPEPPFPNAIHLVMREQWSNGTYKQAWAFSVFDLETLLTLMRASGKDESIILSSPSDDITKLHTQNESLQWMLNQPHITIYDSYIE